MKLGEPRRQAGSKARRAFLKRWVRRIIIYTDSDDSQRHGYDNPNDKHFPGIAKLILFFGSLTGTWFIIAWLLR
jgi:hypothetical protein